MSHAVAWVWGQEAWMAPSPLSGNRQARGGATGLWWGFPSHPGCRTEADARSVDSGPPDVEGQRLTAGVRTKTPPGMGSPEYMVVT